MNRIFTRLGLRKRVSSSCYEQCGEEEVGNALGHIQRLKSDERLRSPNDIIVHHDARDSTAERRVLRHNPATPRVEMNGPFAKRTSVGHALQSRERLASRAAANQPTPVTTIRNARRQTLIAREARLHKKRTFLSLRSFSNTDNSSTNSASNRCPSLAFDPASSFVYWWSFVISAAFVYNFWIIIYRYSFDEIRMDTITVWFFLDYSIDLLYVFDIAVSLRTGFLEEGVLQLDPTKMRIHYMNSTRFYIDCLCLLPLDFLYFSFGFKSVVRVFRLVKVYKFWHFTDRTERHANYPNVVRSVKLIHYLLAIVHWNACVFKLVSDAVASSQAAQAADARKPSWIIPQFNTTGGRYLYALYWSSLTLTLMGDLPRPESVGAYVFVIFEVIFGMLLFANVLGHIANIVTNVSAARKDFQARLDAVKIYLNLRKVPHFLQEKVIKWFDYLWHTNKISDEEKVLNLIPDKLKAEIAIHVHLETLKRVEIFQNTEEGFLSELVLRLKPVLFSPGDFICRKGEVGKEMYIINRGKLHVISEAETERTREKVVATLSPGNYFGEISILNMGTAGNRRTASVRSVGYSDLFCLSKTELCDVLKEYPAARVKLEAVAVKRLQQFKKKPAQEAAMSRSKSTPGLLESAEATPLHARMQYRSASPIQVPFMTRSNTAAVVHFHTPPRHSETVSSLAAAASTNQTSLQDFAASSAAAADVETSNQTAAFAHSHISQQHLCCPFYAAAPHLQQLMPPTPSCSYHCSPSLLHCSSPAARPTHTSAPARPHTLQTPLAASATGFTPARAASSASYLPHASIVSPSGYDSNVELLTQEISRLRQRVALLETENTTLSVRLNQQHCRLESRLTELELQRATYDNDGASSWSSRDENAVGGRMDRGVAAAATTTQQQSQPHFSTPFTPCDAEIRITGL